MDYSAIVVWKHAIVCFTIVLREQAYYCVLLHGAAEYLSPMVVNKRFQHAAAFWMHICGNVLEHKDASLLAAWCPRSSPMAAAQYSIDKSCIQLQSARIPLHHPLPPRFLTPPLALALTPTNPLEAYSSLCPPSYLSQAPFPPPIAQAPG